MQSLYWEYETSCYPGDTNISLRGSCKFPQPVFEAYVDEFVKKFARYECKRKETVVLYPSENYSQYCVIVSLNINHHEKIDYPGYYGPNFP